MPDIDNIDGIKYPDIGKQFTEICKSVRGDAKILQSGENINGVIKNLYPEAKVIASNLTDITIATVDPDKIVYPHLIQWNRPWYCSTGIRGSRKWMCMDSAERKTKSSLLYIGIYYYIR